MTWDVYLIISAVVAAVALVGGIFYVVFNEDEGDLAVAGVFVAVLAAPLLGIAWPLTGAVIVLTTLAGIARVAVEVARERRDEQRAKAAETDGDRYRRLAREERNMARTHRSNSPELASMHHTTAKQYDQLAALYDREHQP